MKIAYISQHPAPYRDPVLRELSNCGRFQMEVFNVCFFDKGHSFWGLNHYGYAAKPLFPSKAGVLRQTLLLLKKFVFSDYDFVLYPGYVGFPNIIAMISSVLLRKKFGFSADTIKECSPTGFRHFIKRFIVQHTTLIFVPGEAGRNFWRREYGVSSDKIVLGEYALDNSAFYRKICLYREQRLEIRKKYGLSANDIVYLMVANMIPSRHYPITTDGFLKFAGERSNYKFMIVGNGSELEKMKKKALERPSLIVSGGVSFEEMLSLYAIADVYVHGGEEPASTALVIGAIAGLPLISSNAVGCSADVLSDGKSGIVVDDYLNVDSWACAFQRLDAVRLKWESYGLEARHFAEKLNAPIVSRGLIEAIASIGDLK